MNQLSFVPAFVLWAAFAATVPRASCAATLDTVPRATKSALQISGRVTDKVTKEPLAGVIVLVKGTSQGTQTDKNGFFSLTLPSPRAVLVVKYLGYASQEYSASGKASVQIALQSSAQSLRAVNVQARRRARSEAATLLDRQSSAIMVDNMSAQNIEKTASITTTQALQRITGVTITDDKYVAIRGLGDRNVIAQLNGARLSSASPDRNSVPLDLVPAGLLDNISVYKTISPDHPADATAGIIELKTKSFPDTLTLEVSAQVGTNSEVGLNGNINAFNNSKIGFFGQKVKKKNFPQDLIDLTTAYSAPVPSKVFYYDQSGVLQQKTVQLSTSDQLRALFSTSRTSAAQTTEARRIDQIMQRFDPVLTTSYRPVAPNQVYNLTFGNKYRLGSQTIGLIAGLNYFHRSENRVNAQLNDWSIYQGVGFRYPLVIPDYVTTNNLFLAPLQKLIENTGIERVNYGGLIGVSYQPAKGHEISFSFLGNKGAEMQASYFNGGYFNPGTPNPVLSKSYSLQQQERTLTTYQARGQDRFKVLTLNWNLSSSLARQNDPDARFVNLLIDSNRFRQGVRNAGFYNFLVGNRSNVLSGGQVYDPNDRAYRNLKERNKNATLDLDVPFRLFGQTQHAKTGFYYLSKNRTYSEYVQALPSAQSLFDTNGDLDAIIAPSQIGLRGGATNGQEGELRDAGYVYIASKSINNYYGYSLARATYQMVDLSFGKFRLAGGVRFEDTEINGTIDTAGTFNNVAGVLGSRTERAKYASFFDPNIVYHTGYKPYWSWNLVYSLTSKTALRASYSETLARPELRELIPLTQYDPYQLAILSGNPKLKNQFTRSYDLRADWFPKPGEVISATLFYKKIFNQITKIYTNDSAGTKANGFEFNQTEFVNDPEIGKVLGVELEVRKRLSVLSPRLSNFSIGCNVLLANSSIKKNVARLDKSRTVDIYSPSTSPLFEQPPYSINVLLDYESLKTGSSFTLNFNRVGERLVQIVLTGEKDLYDRPVNLLDFVFNQRLYKRLSVKGYAKNILNPQYKEVYTDYGYKGKYNGIEYDRKVYRRGSEFLIGLVYNLF